MENAYQRLLRAGIVVAAAAVAAVAPAAAQTFTEFPVPTANSDPYGITTGPDGALWFLEANANKIGRITTAGAITEFPSPNSSSGCSDGPYGITGVDCALRLRHD